MLHKLLVIFCYFQTINICRYCKLLSTHTYRQLYISHIKNCNNKTFYCCCLNSSNNQTNKPKERTADIKKKTDTQLRHNTTTTKELQSQTPAWQFSFIVSAAASAVLYMAIWQLARCQIINALNNKFPLVL